MKKILDDQSKIFEKFLELVKTIKPIINENKISASTIEPEIIDLTDISKDWEEIADFCIPSNAEEIGSNEFDKLLNLLKFVGEFHFDDPTEFYQFIFNKNSPDEIEVDFDSLEDLSGELWRAIFAYQRFYENFTSFKVLMNRIDRMRGRLEKRRDIYNRSISRLNNAIERINMKIQEAEQTQGQNLSAIVIPIKELEDSKAEKERQIEKFKAKSNLLLGKQWLSTRKGTVKYSVENGILIYEPVELFYGFKEIGRIRKCISCENYFLAERTDAKFCNPKCGNNFRQRKLRDKGNEHLKIRRDSYKRKKEDKAEQIAQKYRRES